MTKQCCCIDIIVSRVTFCFVCQLSTTLIFVAIIIIIIIIITIIIIIIVVISCQLFYGFYLMNAWGIRAQFILLTEQEGCQLMLFV